MGERPVSWIALLAVVLLVLANGFFVAAEFALVAVDRTKVERDAADGRRRARMTLGLLQRLSFHLSGAQLGITITSLLVGLLTEPSIASLLRPVIEPIVGEAAVHAVAIVAAIAIATIVQMIVGELVPKGLAVARPVTTTYMLAPIVRVYGLVFAPLIGFLQGAANRTVRLVGVEPTEELSHVRTLRELQVMVSASSAQGAIPEAATQLITRSIRFEGKTAEDVLVPRTAVRALQRDASVDDLVAVAVDSGHSRFLVYGADIDDVLGTVHVRSVHEVPRAQRSTVRVGTLVRPVMAVPESRELGDVLMDFRREGAHLAVVVDEYGGTAGIVTLEDVLEEIVGEIGDEHDLREEPRRVVVRHGEWSLPGLSSPDEVADRTGFTVPDGEYETLGGFLLDRLGHLPTVGESHVERGWIFEVAEMDRRRIATVRVVAPAGDEEADH